MAEAIVFTIYMLGMCTMYFGLPTIALAWLLLGGKIFSRRLGSTKYASIEELTDDLLRRIGFASPIVIRAARLDKLRIEGAIPQGKRRASVSFFATPSLRWNTKHVRFQLEVDRVVKASFRPNWFKGFLTGTTDQERVNRAFAHDPGMREALETLFRTHSIEHVLIWDGKVHATARLASVGPEEYLTILRLLDRIAASFEPVRLNVRVLGGERRAHGGMTGEARCGFCHDHVTGEEPDLVACALCGTVLHDACWNELGRCPVLGCTGVKPERGAAVRA